MLISYRPKDEGVFCLKLIIIIGLEGVGKMFAFAFFGRPNKFFIRRCVWVEKQMKSEEVD